jgi:hypothetical protein
VALSAEVILSVLRNEGKGALRLPACIGAQILKPLNRRTMDGSLDGRDGAK